MTHTPTTERKRGSTVQNPATTKYSWQEWAKGYAAWIAVLPLYLGLWAFAITFKRVPAWLHRKLLRDWERVTASRTHNVRIPTDPKIPAYMLRWWKIRRNAFFNTYYHLVKRSDDDTALHDHPWWNFSIVLEGGYFEHRILEGGVNTKIWYPAGSVLFRRRGAYAHRLELVSRSVPVVKSHGVDPVTGDLVFTGSEMQELPVKTIFVTGPVLRRWGFHHPEQWVDAYDWDEFLNSRGIVSMKMAGYAEQLEKPQ